MKKVKFILLAVTVLVLAACGGGGEPTAAPAVASGLSSATTTQASTPQVAATVDPTLLVTTGVGFAGLQLSKQAFASVVSGTENCTGAVFAQNQSTGKIEAACADGRVLQYDTHSRTVQQNRAFAARVLYSTAVACAPSGPCFFGRGMQSAPWQLPSDATLYVQEGDTVTSVPLPDRKENRAPYVVGLTDDGHAVVVTRGYNQSEIGVHRFSLATRQFVSSCSLHSLELTGAQVSDTSVFFMLERTREADYDVLEVDSTTCAGKQVYRLPVPDYGIKMVGLLVIDKNYLFVGGGSDRLATPMTGVWKIDRVSGQVIGFKPTTSQPTAGVASKVRGTMYVSLYRGRVLELSLEGLHTLREFSLPNPLQSYDGSLFIAE